MPNPVMLRFQAEDAQGLRLIIRRWSEVTAEATRCKKHSTNMKAVLDASEKANKDAIPRSAVESWCRDVISWEESDTGIVKVPDVDSNKFSKAVFDAMYNKDPPYGSIEAVTMHAIKKPDGKASDPVEKNFHQLSTETMPLLLALTIGAGFDKCGYGEGIPQFWPAIQPLVGRQISQERITTSSEPNWGVMDLLVGKAQSHQEGESVLLDRLGEEMYHGCLFAFDSVMGTDEPNQPIEESVGLESAILPIHGMEAARGLIHTDTPPRKCTYDDANELFKSLTNVRFDDVPGISLADKSDEEKALMCFHGVERVLERFNLGTEQGWINFYIVLLGAVGMPKLTNNNPHEHKFLPPRSLLELIDRSIVLFLACTNIRSGMDNGVLRITALRHIMMGIFPDRNGTRFNSRAHWNRKISHYFEEIHKPGVENDDRICQVILPLMNKKVSTTICLGEVSTGNMAILREHGRKRRNAQDQATRKELIEILSDGAEYRRANLDQFSDLAKNKQTGEEVAKPLIYQILQARWLWYKSIVMDPNLVETVKIKAELAEYAGKWFTDPKRKKKIGNWDKEYDTVAAVKSLRDFKSTHSGCESMHETMVTDHCNGEFEKDKEKIAENPLAVSFVCSSIKNGQPWRGVLSVAGVANGSPIMPEPYRVCVALGYVSWDTESLLTLDRVLQNNGRGHLIPPPGQGLVTAPKTRSGAGDLTKVRYPLIRPASPANPSNPLLLHPQ